MFQTPLTTEVGMSVLTLTALEVVLGIDNIVFISMLTNQLPPHERARARQLGLLGALGTRLVLITALSVLTGLTTPLFHFFGTEFSAKSLLLILGGLFLIFKATREIHDKLDRSPNSPDISSRGRPTFKSMIAQIILLDFVFSIDSVITAIGMTQYLSVMVIANVIALGVMMVAAETVSAFIEHYASVKMLALSFLFMIGFLLLGEGFGFSIPKGYAYFAMGFSVLVEILNIRVGATRKKAKAQANAAPSPASPEQPRS